MWKQLPEEEKHEYVENANAKMKLHREQLSEWGNKISEPFQKWADIQGIATAQKVKTTTTYNRK